jgi:hypothetical protein
VTAQSVECVFLDTVQNTKAIVVMILRLVIFEFLEM